MTNPKEPEESVNLDKCWDEEKVELTDTDLEGVDGGEDGVDGTIPLGSLDVDGTLV